MQAAQHDQAASARGAGALSILGVASLQATPFRNWSIFSATRIILKVCSGVVGTWIFLAGCFV
jgi:hypothetical protein